MRKVTTETMTVTMLMSDGNFMLFAKVITVVGFPIQFTVNVSHCRKMSFVTLRDILSVFFFVFVTLGNIGSFFFFFFFCVSSSLLHFVTLCVSVCECFFFFFFFFSFLQLLRVR
jgi:hypothetical protein